MSTRRWLVQVFVTEIRKVFAYRFDFWLQFLMSIFAHVGVAFFLWSAVFDYQDVDMLQGYSFHGLMFYYLLVPLLGRIINGSGFGTVSREIYEGSLTRYLIYPVSFFQYKYAQYLSNAVVFYAQLFLTVLIFILIFGFPSDISFTLNSIVMGSGTILFAGFLSFTINTSLEMIAFWADNVWTLLVMFRFCTSLLGGAMIPLAFFPDTWSAVLNVMPFTFLMSFPIRCFLGKVGLTEWVQGIGIMAVWSGLFSFVCIKIWHKGKFHYTGVGI